MVSRVLILIIISVFVPHIAYSEDIDLELVIPGTVFGPGSACSVDLNVLNEGPTLTDAQLFVALNFGTGDYWFYPGWVHYPPDVTWQEVCIGGRSQSLIEIIPEFYWPGGTGEFYGARLLAAIMHGGELVSNVSDCTFGWSETPQPTLFRFLQTVQVTPDNYFERAAFVRVWYVPSTDSLVVTFLGRLTAEGTAMTGCLNTGNFYKEYTLDIGETGRRGSTLCDQFGDVGSLMTESTFYTANTIADSKTGRAGWLIVRYDVFAAPGGGPRFEETVRSTHLLDHQENVYPLEQNGDPMVAYLNGMIDVSSWYLPDSRMGHYVGHGTHHNFFTPALDFDHKMILQYPGSPKHMEGSSLIFVDGFYYLVTASSFFGNIIVMKYDADWHFVEAKTIRTQAHWSTGIVYDNGRFYLVYLDTSLKTYEREPYFPIYLNVRLAAFDRDWNLVQDIAVTDYSPTNRHLAGRPGLLLHGNRLFVSYDVATITAEDEELQDWQAYVSIYELL